MDKPIIQWMDFLDQISDNERPQSIMVSADNWPYDRSKQSGFDVWLLDENGAADILANETCALADPKCGKFVFYWIRDHRLDLERVRACRIDCTERGSITWKYHGIFDGPSLCTTTQDTMTKRIYVEFNILPNMEIDPVKKTSLLAEPIPTKEEASIAFLDRILDDMRPR